MAAIEELIERVSEYWINISSSKNIICFGAGQKGKQTLELLRERGIFPIAFCDNNKDLIGKNINDLQVLSYEELKQTYSEYTILITTTIEYALEIKNNLLNHGEKNKIYFMANPFKVENKFLSIEDIKNDVENYISCYNIFDDDLSKEIFIEFLYWKATGDLSASLIYTDKNEINEFFDKDIIKWDNGIYIDVGAYTGDSLLRFFNYSDGRYKHIYAIEPDESSFLDLKNFVKFGRIPNVTLIQKACWSNIENKEWHSASDIGYSYESSNLYRNISETISLVEADIENNKCTNIIETDTIDNMFFGKVTPELIKLDVLASEVPILYGAEKLIKSTKPNIIMEMGTNSNHLTECMLFLYRLNSDYSFVLRQKYSFGNSRTALYIKNK